MCDITAFLYKLSICHKYIKTKGKKGKKREAKHYSKTLQQNTELSNLRGQYWAQLTNLKLVIHISLARCKPRGSEQPDLIKTGCKKTIEE